MTIHYVQSYRDTSPSKSCPVATARQEGRRGCTHINGMKLIYFTKQKFCTNYNYGKLLLFLFLSKINGRV